MLEAGLFKNYITIEELEAVSVAGKTRGKMLGGFIKYLRRTDWRNRGSHTDDTDDDPPPPWNESQCGIPGLNDSRIPGLKDSRIRGFQD